MGFKRSRVQIPAARFFRLPLFRRPGGQERIDQLWQFVAVTTFEDRSYGNVEFSQPLAERGKILPFERHMQEWITRVAIEACRDK